MFVKNRKKTVGLCVMVVTASLALAALWAILATPETALAAPPEGKGKGGGGGGEVGQLIPVCITFEAGRIQSDQTDEAGGIPYCDGELKKKVTAIVGRNFSIVLDGNTSNKKTAGRTVWLDLSGGLGCTASVKVDINRPSASGPVGDRICDECFDFVPDLPAERFGGLTSGRKYGYPDNAKLEILGRDLDGLGVVGNSEGRQSTVETNARLKFSVGGESYSLHWGPFKMREGGATFCPGSGHVTVERLDLNTWRIASTVDHLACLYRETSEDPEYLGQFVVPFGMTAVAMEHEETVWGDEPWGIGDDSRLIPIVCD